MSEKKGNMQLGAKVSNHVNFKFKRYHFSKSSKKNVIIKPNQISEHGSNTRVFGSFDRSFYYRTE